MTSKQELGIVAIGRNEGERLKACLRSLGGVAPTVYVDSGSTDGSQDFARAMGVGVAALAVPPGFTAARARNTGLAALLAEAPSLELVQMIDGDCQLAPGWLDAATAALAADPGLAAVFGRRREKFPDASLYNRICDDEWNVPIGPALSTGGDALFRVVPLTQAGGYTESLIAGEEPDLCLRMRAAGWRILRIDHEMTLHDAAITRFGQWWQRARRAGYAYTEHGARHGDHAIPAWTAEVRRIRLWALWLPLLLMASLLAAIIVPVMAVVALLTLLAYPAQVARIAWRDRRRWTTPRVALGAAMLNMVGKFAQLAGMLRFARDRRAPGGAKLIEYKRAT